MNETWDEVRVGALQRDVAMLREAIRGMLDAADSRVPWRVSVEFNRACETARVALDATGPRGTA